MLRRKDDEVPEQHVRPWLEKRGYPLENYWNLSHYYKRVLHNQVCGCTRNSPSSDRELRGLYQKLQSGEKKGSITSPNAVDSMTNRELQEHFSPLSSSETRTNLYKY